MAVAVLGMLLARMLAMDCVLVQRGHQFGGFVWKNLHNNG